MLQVDLIKLCKEKSIERNKNTIIELMRASNNKNITSLGVEAFFKFL